MAGERVLVTGMSGLIGGAVRKRLEGRYTLSALNRRPIEGVPCHRADIADLAAIRPAFQDVDVVVHLAAIARGGTPWDDVLAHNIIGTYNVLEAARLGGVGRIVYASSGATVSNCERDFPFSALVAGRYEEVRAWPTLTHESPVRPNGLYGCSKVWGEALARHYSDTYGISAICLRIGAVNREDRPTSPRHFSVWCSQRDVTQMIERAITAPASVRFDVFYVVSDNKWSYRDLEHARAVLGYEPQDRAEDHR
ncbi:MAG TPA: NAD(P)-dependent oxidoreductase [Methylomirabilota bacterium]|jgi:nucleoside-diphosphate-sugar epimerase|nr:NAD(P)-dependent oxidoreductase [Methylomirabilota bacterium]